MGGIGIIQEIQEIQEIVCFGECTSQQCQTVRRNMKPSKYHNFFIKPASQIQNFTQFVNIPPFGFQNHYQNNNNIFPKSMPNMNNINNYQIPVNHNNFNNNHVNNNPYINYNNNNFMNYNKNFYNNNINSQNNFNNNISNNVRNDQIFKESEHLRGLVNIASTCYMNSTLQCFAHIKELFMYFQKEKIIKLIDAPENKDKLFTIFAQLISCLWFPYDTTPLYPYKFKERLGQLNPLFQGAMPNDAKDLLTFMLMQLHDELNRPINNNNGMNQNMIANINMQQNKKLMLEAFVPYFKNNYRSIISELFYGLTYNETQCQFCKRKLYNYQTFNFLIFPLAQVLNYKMQKVNFQNNFNNTVTLEECFEYNQTYQPLNDYYCNACGQNSTGMYANFISATPNIIIIILNRGIGLQYKVKIDFEENLDLKNYVEYKKDNSFYELLGVVTHYGESGASGHFMARCKSPFDNYWYLYNDAIVQKIEYFTKENFLQGNPYILFYKKTKFANQ